MSEIKLNEITSGTTIKEMVEIINSNFTKIVESGGGPTGVPGEDGVAGPEGKRGNGIFVIKDESEIDEGKEYEKEVNEFLKNDSSDSEEGKYKEGDCIIYKSGLYIVKMSPDGDNTLVAEYMGTLKGEKGDKGDTGSNEEEGGSSNQWDVIGIDENYGYQFTNDSYKFLIIGSGIDENKLGSYGAEKDYNHSLWILNGEKGIALYGKENEDGTFSKGTISLSSDDKLMLTGARGVCVNGISFNKGEINHSNSLKLVTDFNTITLDNSGINLNSTTNGGDIKLNTLSNIEITNGKNHITLTSTLNITGEDITLKCSGQCNVSGTNVSGTNASLPGGEITIDKTGVGLSGSGKGINIGVTALSGYDVDIVGKTYISGDLVVGGDYHNIGDLMVISSKKDAPEGWFSNKNISDELKMNQSILFRNNNKSNLNTVPYNTLKEIAANNSDLVSLDENEYKYRLELVKFILTNTDEPMSSVEYKVNTINDSLFCDYNEFFTKNQDLLKYLYIDSDESGLLFELENESDEIKSLQIVKDLQQEKSFCKIINGSEELLIVFAFNFNAQKVYSNDLFEQGIPQMISHIKSESDSYITEDTINLDNVMTVIRNYMRNKFNIEPTNNESEIKKIFGTKDSNCASIIVRGLENYYITNKEKFYVCEGKFALPVLSNNYFQYIMKYKDSSVETVGIRDNKKW